MKAPVGLLSGRTVLRSKMEGLCPDKFTGHKPEGNANNTVKGMTVYEKDQAETGASI